MRKATWTTILSGFMCACLLFSACHKDNTLGIDNDKVIKIPYSLYAADQGGSIINTNDGSTFRQMFPPDGFNNTKVLSSGDYLLVIKQNLHMSTNNGKNLNVVYSNVNHFPWASMAYDYPTYNRVYVTSTQGRGIAYSEDHGETWELDNLWDEENLPPYFSISSFAGLPSGKLFAYSNEGNILFYKDNVEAPWTQVNTEGAFPVNPAQYFLVANQTTLFLVDYSGIGLAWYSLDEGIHWIRYERGDLPYGEICPAAVSPGEGNSLVIATDSLGIYHVGNGAIRFQNASGGLKEKIQVYSLAAKDNRYKNDVLKRYIYAGSSNGLYRSENEGKTWYLITSGAWSRKYVSVN